MGALEGRRKNAKDFEMAGARAPRKMLVLKFS
jgi:hypothetical protein